MQYKLVRSPRRRRSLSLKVTEKGEIVVRAPLFTPKFLIDRFVTSKKTWLSKQLAIKKPALPPLKANFTPASLKQYLDQELTTYSAILGLTPKTFKLKTVKSYWGNCAPDGTLRFNLQLRFAPPAAVSYVVVHELVHLKHKGHGKRFWNLVNQTYPAANEMRALLRRLSRERSIT